MQVGRDDGGARAPYVIWQARPTVKAVLLELLGALVVSGLYVFLLQLGPAPRTWARWVALVPPVASLVGSLCVAVRGRVVLRPDGIEVRRVLTRRYPWDSLLSLTVEEDGRIEITPKGWVRKLPIPRAEVPEAFETISRWRAEATGQAQG